LYIIRGEAGFDEAALRQGDIIVGVPFPLLEHGKINVLGGVAQEYDFANSPAISARTHNHRNDPGWVTIQVPAKFGTCIVTSNCCDLEPRDGRVQSHTLTLARLRPIPDDIRNDAERFASLSTNRDPRDQENPGYVDFFYLQPHALIDGRDWNVHFSQIVTLPTTDINLLLRKKVLQLDDRTRVKFKMKLAYTLGRINADETNAGLDEPWAPALAPAPPPADPEEPAPVV
jgi:hypothetical protein